MRNLSNAATTDHPHSDLLHNTLLPYGCWLSLSLALYKLLQMCVGFRVGYLHGRMFSEKRRGRVQDSRQSTVKREPHVPHHIDHHSRKVGSVFHLQFGLEMKRGISKVSGVDPENRSLAILHEGHVRESRGHGHGVRHQARNRLLL